MNDDNEDVETVAEIRRRHEMYVIFMLLHRHGGEVSFTQDELCEAMGTDRRIEMRVENGNVVARLVAREHLDA